MALSNLSGWNNRTKGMASSCGTSCGASDKKAACGSACGAGDKSKAAACGSSCGAGDK